METAATHAIDPLRTHLAASGQDHVLGFWSELPSAQQMHLAGQLERVNLAQLRELFAGTSAAPTETLPPEPLRPENVRRLPDTMEAWEQEQRAAAAGEELLEAGRVGVVLVAGGQGTRLGFDGPKGTYAIGAISHKSLFQLHVEKILALGRRYKVAIPLLVMTSPENDAATRQFFAEQRAFGMEPGQVSFFVQGTMPAVDRTTGRLLLATKDCIAVSPNGHGGVLQALADGGHLRALGQRGVTRLFYFQVDNPLVKIADPIYLGMHELANSEMSVKVISKNAPGEKVGVVVERGGQLEVVEYSDLPRDVAEMTDKDGRLTYWAGNIAIHVFNVDFLERLAGASSMLPFHRAIKAVPFVDAAGQIVKPTQPNAIKFETFVFDALPMARKALVVETSRQEEFEPLKNATGENSPASVRQAMSDLHGSWLESVGVGVPRGADGHVTVPIEISPLYALDAEELRDRSPRIEEIKQALYLDA